MINIPSKYLPKWQNVAKSGHTGGGTVASNNSGLKACIQSEHLY